MEQQQQQQQQQQQHPELLANKSLHPVDLWELKFPPSLLCFLAVAYIAVFVLSLIGNAVVIATVCRIPSMHTTVNCFICNLSTADILMAIFCLPLNFISNTFTNWIAGKALCKAMPYLQGVAVAASVTTLSVIAFDRYIAICRPLRRNFFTKRGALLLVLGIWAYVLTLLSPWLVKFDLTTTINNNRTYLICINTMSDSTYLVYQVGVIFCLLYAGPLLFIAVCYVMVAKKLRRRSSRRHGDYLRKSTSQAQDRRQTRRLVKMLVTVVLIFALSWLPLHTVAVLGLMNSTRSLLMLVRPGLPIVQWLATSNCCVNPWIYCAFSRTYRANFVNTLKCRFERQRMAGGTGTFGTTGGGLSRCGAQQSCSQTGRCSSVAATRMSMTSSAAAAQRLAAKAEAAAMTQDGQL